MRYRALLACAVVAVCAVGFAARADAAAAAPSLRELVGQRLVVAFDGTTPSRALLRRVRAGRVGGVILFGQNVASRDQLRALTRRLQRAARRGGQPRLIVATDQEGGLVKRIPWAPPNVSAEQLGTLSASRTMLSGRLTGEALRAVGVNIDLAPVADVPRSPADFIMAQHRAFSTSRFIVARRAAAFAEGLERGRVVPTLKHFPGLGLTAVSTDDALVRIRASRAVLMRRLLPYTVAFRRPLAPLVMLSTAIYPALAPRAAAWSRTIVRGILRGRLGFRGVTITDSLDSAAAVRGTTDAVLALRCARAGADLLLVTGSAGASKSVFAALVDAARAGAIPLDRLRKSHARIVALKRRL